MFYRSNHRESPVNEAKIVNGLNGHDTLGDVEPRHILTERIVFDQHAHQVTPYRLKVKRGTENGNQIYQVEIPVKNVNPFCITKEALDTHLN